MLVTKYYKPYLLGNFIRLNALAAKIRELDDTKFSHRPRHGFQKYYLITV